MEALRTSFVTSLRTCRSITWHVDLCTYSTKVHFMQYAGNHSACHPTSACHTSSYSPSKVKLTEPSAAQTLLSTLKRMNVYKMAPEFCRVRTSHSVCLHIIVFCYGAVTLTGWRASTTNCSPISQSGFTSPQPASP